MLRFLNADPDLFDVVFVANSTAAIKLVADAFRDRSGGFHYKYHVDSHTSVVGVRELASQGNQCLSDDAVYDWLTSSRNLVSSDDECVLFGYPGQSNLSGYRPPLAWCSDIYTLREKYGKRIYSLFDAAGLLSSTPMNFSDPFGSPDFTVFSFYKIFGLPDLGALVVRREISDIFSERKFFGGGTVDMIIALGDQWHSPKQSAIHDRLEDGTIAFHSVSALASAFSTHSHIFGSMSNVSRHTSFLARCTYDKLSSLRHSNGRPVCQVYSMLRPDFGVSQGPVISFNLLDAEGVWIGKSEVEKLAAIRNIQLRTGGLCNPGGIATNLQLTASELRSNFAAGLKCGDDNDILNGKPTGVVRVSFGAMSNMRDGENLVDFIKQFFVQVCQVPPSPPLSPLLTTPAAENSTSFYVQSLSVYPIKSCGAFNIPPGIPWEVRPEGLSWDREWCLVHQGTGVALNQKRYPAMATIIPSIDLSRRVLRVQHGRVNGELKTLEVSLDYPAASLEASVRTCSRGTSSRSAMVCGESQRVLVSTSNDISTFFTNALDVPCTLARHQRGVGLHKKHIATDDSSDEADAPSPSQRPAMPGRFPSEPLPSSISSNTTTTFPKSKSRPRLLANESPILLVSQSSVDALNQDINGFGNAAAAAAKIPLISASSLRGNIVIAQPAGQKPAPYAEDHWTSLHIGDGRYDDDDDDDDDGAGDGGADDGSASDGTDAGHRFEVMGPCQRCQMVCVNQQSGERGKEPFSTLARTRRRDGKVWFGMHICLGGGGARGGEEREQDRERTDQREEEKMVKEEGKGKGEGKEKGDETEAEAEAEINLRRYRTKTESESEPESRSWSKSKNKKGYCRRRHYVQIWDVVRPRSSNPETGRF